MKYRLQSVVVILAGAAIVLGAAGIAAGAPVPYPIPINPTPPTPADPSVPKVYVCVWYQVSGPGPHSFTPAPGEDVQDVEVDIPGDEALPAGDQFSPDQVAGETGPFNQWELLAMVTGTHEDLTVHDHYSVGHWFDGSLASGNLITVSSPTVGPNDIWYVHFTPEPTSLSFVAIGALALLRKRRR